MSIPTDSTAMSLTDRVLLLLATGLGMGYAPKAPGTFGSLLGPLLLWAIGLLDLQTTRIAAIGVIAFLIGIPICNAGIRLLHAKDPSQVVFDEIAAFFWVYLFVPVTGITAIVGFLLFRLFDIWKPWPIRQFEKLPSGLGIMADDAVAGVFAGAILFGLSRFF
ncbi:phosphatidylglycerophosphatase A family protein [Planctomicrobium sp. SH668]|uniref:phosphatidylglycerophosphatase A family protein n=1 Tax=Planctomicrobium sp. SH668 TaxID=3448126 RepID=UPI003F5AEBB1